MKLYISALIVTFFVGIAAMAANPPECQFTKDSYIAMVAGLSESEGFDFLVKSLHQNEEFEHVIILAKHRAVRLNVRYSDGCVTGGKNLNPASVALQYFNETLDKLLPR